MSTAQVTPRTSVGFPGNTIKLGDAHRRTNQARVPPLNLYGERENGEQSDDSRIHAKKASLDPLDKSKLKSSVLKQYRTLVRDDTGITCRSLPPVKLSVKLSSRTKFVDSPRVDSITSSKILKPLLTMKTHTAGHHVFTEGISKKSKLPNPAFALQQMKVPYSNLPDNVMIYKEKNKFAFGVKRDQPEPSPYRLTPRPPDLPSLQLHVSVPNDSPTGESNRGGKQYVDTMRNRQGYQQLKSNKVVLDPILPNPKGDCAKSGSNNSSSQSFRPSKEPLAPCNTSLGSESPHKTTTNGCQSDRRVSYVSIGDNVTQNIYERQKQNTRKLYPMFDYKSRQDEVIKRAKFGAYPEYIPPKQEQEPVYTYKVSSRSLEFAHGESSPGTVSPIKNNIRNRAPPIMSGPRGLGSFRRYAKDNSEYDSELSFHEQKIRRLYRRAYSPGSNSSGEMSYLPGNPPPSVTSHILSEDLPPNFAEFKQEMITLLEEKEKTVSVLSVKNSEKKDTESNNDLDKTFVNAEKVLEDAPTDTSRSDGYDTQTDTDIQMETMNSRLADERRFVTNHTLREQSEVENEQEHIASTERRTVEIPQNSTSRTSPTKGMTTPIVQRVEHEARNEKQKATKPTNGSPKQMLGVPTFSLDKLSHHPMGGTVRERTSLSRTIQNMAVPEQKPAKPDIAIDVEQDVTSPTNKDNTLTMSVTKLRLFSESSTASFDAPRVSLTNEHGDKFEFEDIDEATKPPETIITEPKRLVNNANILFISPLVNDKKAKRQ